MNIDHLATVIRAASRWAISRFRNLSCGLLLFLAMAPVHATTVIPPTFSSLVSQADYIVRAVVKSVTSEMHTNGQSRHIITKVELDVRQVISGTPPQPLVLVMLGGKIGTEEMVVDGAPKFQVGDEDILFVHGNGRNFNPLVALMHGRYPILRDTTGRDYVARANRAPLFSEQDVNLPMAPESSHALAEHAATQPLSPDDFVGRIQKAVKAAAKPALQP